MICSCVCGWCLWLCGGYRSWVGIVLVLRLVCCWVYWVMLSIFCGCVCRLIGYCWLRDWRMWCIV